MRDAETTMTARERLEASRLRMRGVLIPVKRPAGVEPDEADYSGIVGTVNHWLDDMRANPIAAAVIDAVRGWWSHHPLHAVSSVGNAALRDFAGPLIREYPFACVGGALVIGVIGAKIKPWRWVLRPALFAGLTSHVVTRLMSDAPLEFILDALNRFRPAPRPAGPAMDEPDFSAASPVDGTASRMTTAEAEAAAAP